MLNIIIIGSGAIGTALSNILVAKNNIELTLLSIEKEVVESINNLHYNKYYFPNIRLHDRLQATLDKSVLSTADVIFLAIPSSAVVAYVKENNAIINPNAILVNLAKGFGNNHKTIIEYLQDISNNEVVTLKGPGFAREIIKEMPTGLTLGSTNQNHFQSFNTLFNNTCISLDFSQDIIGVELSSILKNIYAIALGIIDAHFDSPNLRFKFLTRSFKEMKEILVQFGGKQETMFNYCGFGDFGLTALNDLSRNRTLGLLIGKGFFTQNISDKVLLEGRIAVNVFCEEISKDHNLDNYHIIKELYKVFNENRSINDFLKNVI